MRGIYWFIIGLLHPLVFVWLCNSIAARPAVCSSTSIGVIPEAMARYSTCNSTARGIVSKIPQGPHELTTNREQGYSCEQHASCYIFLEPPSHLASCSDFVDAWQSRVC
ncbi:hypothetical protein V8C35DRAFT_145474 [Trichoderma chlorosporum]